MTGRGRGHAAWRWMPAPFSRFSCLLPWLPVSFLLSRLSLPCSLSLRICPCACPRRISRADVLCRSGRLCLLTKQFSRKRRVSLRSGTFQIIDQHRLPERRRRLDQAPCGRELQGSDSGAGFEGLPLGKLEATGKKLKKRPRVGTWYLAVCMMLCMFLY